MLKTVKMRRLLAFEPEKYNKNQQFAHLNPQYLDKQTITPCSQYLTISCASEVRVGIIRILKDQSPRRGSSEGQSLANILPYVYTH